MQKRWRLIVFSLIIGAIVITGTTIVFRRPSEGRPLLEYEEWNNALRVTKKGMTPDEVRAAIGEPHDRRLNKDDTSSWLYYCRSSFSPFIDGCVDVVFDSRGLVKGVYTDP